MGNGMGGRATVRAAGLAAAARAAFAPDQQLGARTKAMGGSYTAFEDDPVSIELNPAGIATQPNQMSISYQTDTTYPLLQGPESRQRLQGVRSGLFAAPVLQISW